MTTKRLGETVWRKFAPFIVITFKFVKICYRLIFQQMYKTY